MKLAITPSYTFSASSKQVDLSSIPSFDIKLLYAIVNITAGQTIYAVGCSDLGLTSILGGVLTLVYDTTSMSNSDKLMVIYDQTPGMTVQNGSGGSAVNIQDGGNSITVDGSVTANIGSVNGLALDATLTGGTQKSIVRGGAKGSTTAADVTSSASGANHQALDVMFYDASGNPIVSFASTQYAEDTAHVSGDLMNMAGVVQKSADAALSDDGDRSLLQVDSTGYLKANVKVCALPSGAATSANQVTTNNSLASIDGKLSVTGGALNVNISSGGVTQYAEDTVHVSGDLMNMAGVVQKSADGALSGDGDRSLLQVDSNGFLKVNVKATDGQTTAANPVQFTVITTIDGIQPKYECQIASSVKQGVASLVVPAGKKWFITSWDGSGDSKGYYQLMKQTVVGATTLYDGCESTTGWTVSNLSSFSAPSSSPYQGTYSFTASLATNSSGIQSGYFEKASLNLDWSAVSSIVATVKRSGTYGAATDVALKIYTASNSYTFPGLVVGISWADVSFDLSQVGFSLSAVTKIQFIYTEHNSGTYGPTIVWLDNIRTSTQDVFEPIDQFFAAGYIPYQNQFPTNLAYAAGTILCIFVTNKDSATGVFEIGLNGREISV